MIAFYQPQSNGRMRPMISSIPAGIPQPVGEEFTWVDLDDLLTTNTDATIYGRVIGFSLIEAEIYDGDILIIDTESQATNGDVVVVRINGETTCKFWRDVCKMTGVRHLFLVPANSDFKTIEIKETDTVEIIGVVDYVIHKKRNRR
jgi:DNA polymerase V